MLHPHLQVSLQGEAGGGGGGLCPAMRERVGSSAFLRGYLAAEITCGP